MEEKYKVYILECRDGTLYTGLTTDVIRRVEEHNTSDIKGAKYTRVRRPVKLVFVEGCKDRSVAAKREYSIKNMTRKQKLDVIQKFAGKK